MTAGDKPAFVLMPFEEQFTPIFEAIIEPALTEAGYEVTRADSRLDQRNVLQDVVRGLGPAALVVADLTGRNGNVMYELGLCHALGRPTILISQSLEDVPFDLRSYRVTVYSEHFQEAEKLRNTLKSIGAAHLRGEIAFSNPVADFLPGDTAEPALLEPVAGAQAAEDRPNDRGEPATDFLDYLVNAQEAASIFGRSATTIGVETAAIGEKVRDHTERLERLGEGDPGAGAARQFQRIGIHAARDLDAYAKRLEEVIPELEQQSTVLTEGGENYARALQSSANTDEDIGAFRTDVQELAAEVSAALTGTLDYRESITGLQGVTQPLTQASKRVTRDLDRIVSVMEQVEAYCDRVLTLLGDGPEGDATDQE